MRPSGSKLSCIANASMIDLNVHSASALGKDDVE